MAEGVEGLLRVKTRPPGIAPLEARLVDQVVALTLVRKAGCSNARAKHLCLDVVQYR